LSENIHHFSGELSGKFQIESFDDRLGGTAVPAARIGKEKQDVRLMDRGLSHQLPLEGFFLSGAQARAVKAAPVVCIGGIPGQYLRPAGQPATQSCRKGVPCAVARCH
jgi:hypothetical protein